MRYWQLIMENTNIYYVLYDNNYHSMLGFEIDVLAIVPMELLFVFVFGILPIMNTLRNEGIKDRYEWLLVSIIAAGAILTWVVDFTIGRSQFNIWLTLGVMTVGFLLYLQLMRSRDQLHEEPEMGGTSYE